MFTNTFWQVASAPSDLYVAVGAVALGLMCQGQAAYSLYTGMKDDEKVRCLMKHFGSTLALLMSRRLGCKHGSPNDVVFSLIGFFEIFHGYAIVARPFGTNDVLVIGSKS